MVYWGCGTCANRAAWAYVAAAASLGILIFSLGAAKLDACAHLRDFLPNCSASPKQMLIAGAAFIVAALPPLLFFSGCAAPPPDPAWRQVRGYAARARRRGLAAHGQGPRAWPAPCTAATSAVDAARHCAPAADLSISPLHSWPPHTAPTQAPAPLHPATTRTGRPALLRHHRRAAGRQRGGVDVQVRFPWTPGGGARPTGRGGSDRAAPSSPARVRRSCLGPGPRRCRCGRHVGPAALGGMRGRARERRGRRQSWRSVVGEGGGGGREGVRGARCWQRRRR